MMPHMINASPLRMALMLILLMVMAIDSAHAANDKKDLARRLQQKINVLQQENSQLAQDKSQLEEQLKVATEQLNHAKQTAEAANRKGASLDKALKAAEDDKADLSGKLAQAEQKLTETEETLRVTLDTKSQLETGLSERTQELSSCTTKNESLHRVGVELIKQYQQKSCLNGILQSEPLTQLKSAEAENMLDEYREKLDQELVNQRLEESQKPAQQKADVQCVEQKKTDEKHAEQKAEPEKAAVLKEKQQNNLDQLTLKVKKFFEDVEW